MVYGKQRNKKKSEKLTGPMVRGLFLRDLAFVPPRNLYTQTGEIII